MRIAELLVLGVVDMSMSYYLCIIIMYYVLFMYIGGSILVVGLTYLSKYVNNNCHSILL